MALQTLGVFVQGLGLALLLLHWRAKRGLGGGVLAAAWILVAAGAAPWFLNAAPERALALAVLAPMAFGLALLAPDALARIAPNAATRRQRAPVEALENEPTSPGRWSRNAARWFSGVVAAPALAFAAAAAWQALGPGGVADRTVFSGVAFITVWTIAVLWLLSTARPWLAALGAIAIAIPLAGAAYLATLQGAG